LVDCAWLADHLDDGDLRILDCHVVFERVGGQLVVESGRSRWAQGHIPGSAHVDLLEALSDRSSAYRFMLPPSSQVATVMSDLGVGVGTQVVLYDRDVNMWAARVWWILRAIGFDAAAVLDGGWKSWTRAGLPTSTATAPKHPRGEFEIAPRSELFVGKDDVLAAIDDDGVRLVNALGASEHCGETANYGRRGHIPGAINVPAASLVDPDTHMYLDIEALRARFAPALNPGTRRVVTYCGGGIAASSDALILSLLGWDDVSIYDASMSEWGSDPALPLTLDDG
jgi:thiosulfate/3-mercaptopyruvate sulfurtransferase